MRRRASPTVAAALAAALLLGACGGPPATLAAQVQGWANTASWSANASVLAADLGDLDRGIADHKLVALHTACLGLEYDASVLYTELPTPDTELTDELNDALTGFETAGRSCDAAQSLTSASFVAFKSALARAAGRLDAARQRLAAFGVK